MGSSLGDDDVESLRSEVKDLRQKLEEATVQKSSSSSQEEVESLKAKLASQKDQMVIIFIRIVEFIAWKNLRSSFKL